MQNDKLVLVTGGTGFIAAHCIVKLLEAGYPVRTTVRSLTREVDVRAMLADAGQQPGERLTFVAADLMKDEGWAEATAGCTYVMHGASPTPSGDQINLDDWVRPAVDGNLRVLRAARGAGVKRVVLTSAFGAVGMGHEGIKRPYNENDWSNLKGDVAPYQKSKTLSELAAWDYMKVDGGDMELAVVNPTAVLGPVLGADYSHSIGLIKRIMDGLPGCPKISSGFVDVRDVADLHVLAMTRKEAKGERFIAIAGHSLAMVEVARILKRRLGPAARRVSTLELPSWFIKLAAMRDKTLKMTVPHLGKNMNATSEKAITLLGWQPRSAEEAIVATAESLIKHKLVDV